MSAQRPSVGERRSPALSDHNNASDGAPAPEVKSDSDISDELDAKEVDEREQKRESEAPPLPTEDIPPLPEEVAPAEAQDDGWAPVWDDNAQAYYFYNRFTSASQWTNPRVPDIQPGVGNYDRILDRAPGTDTPPRRPHGGYDPTIHGDYDPNADYAQDDQVEAGVAGPIGDPAAIYTATGVFNRFTGKWQPATLTPENYNDENKSKRQMSAFFDVDAAANSHNGKSLKAERSGKKLTKDELKAFKEKRKERKEEKRRAWLRD